MLAIVAPGQGAQTPGLLTPWLTDDQFAARLRELSEMVGIDLVAHGTTSDAETIKDTAVAQPLLVATGLLAAQALTGAEVAFTGADVAAGHSVGEITAAAGVGVLKPADAMVFVRERANGMAEASAARPTGMTAVLRGDPDQVLATIAAVGATPANANGRGQIVAAGTLEQMAALKENPAPGTRVVPLAVAGAFHTEHMEPGRVRVAAVASGMPAHDPVVRLLSNRDGQVVTSGTEYVERMVNQVTSPVRWDLCMASMIDLGVTGLLELPPSGTLTGIAKRNMPGVELFALNTPDQLDEARAFCARHASVTAQES